MTSPIHTAETFFGGATLQTTEGPGCPHAFGRSVSAVDDVTQRLRQAEEGRVPAHTAANSGGGRILGSEAYCFERIGLLLAVKGPVVFFPNDEYRLVPISVAAPVHGAECGTAKTPSPGPVPRAICGQPMDVVIDMEASVRR